VAAEQSRVLIEEAVVRVRVDQELRVREVLGEEVAVLGVHHGVVVAVGDEGRLGDACQPVELGGVPQAVMAAPRPSLMAFAKP
jgi:hypothetical protein